MVEHIQFINELFKSVTESLTNDPNLWLALSHTVIEINLFLVISYLHREFPASQLHHHKEGTTYMIVRVIPILWKWRSKEMTILFNYYISSSIKSRNKVCHSIIFNKRTIMKIFTENCGFISYREDSIFRAYRFQNQAISNLVSSVTGNIDTNITYL
jgi:hypothetical protein